MPQRKPYNAKKTAVVYSVRSNMLGSYFRRGFYIAQQNSSMAFIGSSRCTITTPPLLSCTMHHISMHRIQSNVTRQFQQVGIFLYQYGFETRDRHVDAVD